MHAIFKKNILDFLKQFVIPFSGLSLGNHDYQFKITSEFFEYFEYSEIKHANIDVKVILDKQSTMLIFDFDINGDVELICDRCQDPFPLEIEGEERLIVKFSEEQSSPADEIIILSQFENKIDLNKHIFEYINLLLPYKRVHPDDNNGISLCNKEMIEKLKSLEQTKQTDPRWDALKKINL